MATTCRTADGDILDTICYNYYGHLSGTVEAVLAANEGLGREPQPFRSNILITLPDLPAKASGIISLWD